MDDKKNRIIEIAIPLFARKGVHATSIQEIAEAAGMAKGTLYLYFKSKDDLFCASIHFILERIEALFANHPVHTKNPRQGFQQLLVEQIEFALAYRDFFFMLLNKSAMKADDDMHRTMYMQRNEQLKLYCDYVRALYGKKAGPYVMDVAAMIQAVVTQYCAHALLDDAQMEPHGLAAFLMDRIDDWVNGMIRSGKAPILQEQAILGVRHTGGNGLSDWETDIRLLRETLRNEATGEAEREEGLLYLQVVENELRKPVPVSAVIEGILSSFAASNSPTVARIAGQLAEKLQIAGRND